MVSYYSNRKTTKTVMLIMVLVVLVLVLLLLLLLLVMVVVVEVVVVLVALVVIMALVLVMVIVASEPYSSQFLTLQRKRLSSLSGSHLDVPGCYLTSLPARQLSRDVNAIIKPSLKLNSLLCKKSWWCLQQ